MKKSIGVLLAIIICIGGIWQFSKAKSLQLFGEFVSRVETNSNLVALTFDDGPSKKFTTEVVKTLAQHNVRATFFVTGREAEQNPDQMRELVNAGHELGNHSYSHHRMVLTSPDTVRQELKRTDAAIRAAGYKGTIHFRPPYGTRLVVLPWILKEQNRLTVMWDVEPDTDHRHPASVITAAAVNNAMPGSIILLHPMYSSRKSTREALVGIIEGLRKRGLKPVSFSELLATRKKP